VALAAAMHRLLADPEQARRMGEAGRRAAVARFSIAGQVEQYCRLYDSVLAAVH
jgi:glycosyltransferase involved in cell wall biosynthesis